MIDDNFIAIFLLLSLAILVYTVIRVAEAGKVKVLSDQSIYKQSEEDNSKNSFTK